MAGASADPRGICVSDGKVAPNGRSACTEHASHLSSNADPHGSVVDDLPSDHALAVVHDSLDALLNPTPPSLGQRMVLAYIAVHVEELSRPPTFAEIGEAFGYTASSAMRHVERLKRKGLVTSEPNTLRTLRLTFAGRRVIGRPFLCA